MRFILLALLLAAATQLSGQTVLTNFDDINNVTVSTSQTMSSLFTMMPTVVDNPDRGGINATAKCLGATNVANADWYGNVVSLRLNNRDYDGPPCAAGSLGEHGSDHSR